MIFLNLLQIFSAAGGSCDPADPASVKTFFSLTPWYQYLKGEPDSFGKCIPQIGNGSDIGLIVLAVIDTMLKVAALVAIGFVIYGGIQYIISQGEPSKANDAKNTIINALVGLVIAMSAAGIVSFIGFSIG